MVSTCALAIFHQNLVEIDLGNSIDGKSLSYDLNNKAVLSAIPISQIRLTFSQRNCNSIFQFKKCVNMCPHGN